MPTMSAQMAKMLEQLGDSADKVAENLRAQRIQGVRNTVRFLNPIVRYVQATLLVSNLGMDVIQADILRVTLLDGSQEQTPLPQPVQDFLNAFNGGAYPDLDMPLEKGENAPKD